VPSAPRAPLSAPLWVFWLLLVLATGLTARLRPQGGQVQKYKKIKIIPPIRVNHPPPLIGGAPLYKKKTRGLFVGTPPLMPSPNYNGGLLHTTCLPRAPDNKLWHHPGGKTPGHPGLPKINFRGTLLQIGGQKKRVIKFSEGLLSKGTQRGPKMGLKGTPLKLAGKKFPGISGAPLNSKVQELPAKPPFWLKKTPS